MKYKVILIISALAALLAVACHNHKHENHDHDHVDDHDHDHDTKEVVSEEHGHSGGEIVFTPEQARET